MGTIDIHITNNGPRIRISISSLQSNTLVVGDSKSKNKNIGQNNRYNKKIRVSTNTLHDRFHRSDGAFATNKNGKMFI